MTDLKLDDLLRTRNWARKKIAQGTEPAWAFEAYQRLIKLLDEVLSSGRAPSAG
jgi:hypothetical protein